MCLHYVCVVCVYDVARVYDVVCVCVVCVCVVCVCVLWCVLVCVLHLMMIPGAMKSMNLEFSFP